MKSRSRTKIIAVTTAAALTAFFAGAGASSASATTPEHLGLSWSAPMGSVFTLPTTDGFDDGISANLTSNKAGTVEVTYKRLQGHGGAAFDAVSSFVLDTAASGYAAQVGFADTGLTAGSWELKFTVNGATKSEVVKVGSGVATSVRVTTTPSKVFVNAADAPHYLTPKVVAKDELGTSLPILSGGVTIQASHTSFIGGEPIASINATTAGATAGAANILGEHSGPATLKVSDIQGPVTSAHPPRATIHPELSIAKLTSISISPTFSTLYPNGSSEELDKIFVDVKNNTGEALSLTPSSVRILKGSTLITATGLATTGTTDVNWDGLDNSHVVAGTYEVSASATLPGGKTITKTIDLKVSSALPVEHHVSVTYPGSDFSKHNIHGVACSHVGSSLDCVSTSGEDGHALVDVQVPKEVLALAKPLGYSAAMSVNVTGFSSSGGTASYLWGGEEYPYSSIVDITGNGFVQDGPETADGLSNEVALEIYPVGAVHLNISEFIIVYYYWSVS